MQKIIHSTWVLACLLLGAFPGHAQVTEVTVTVRGMSCPFCAFGVEKKLRTVPGVGSVDVDMGRGTATMEAAEEQFIAADQVSEAVRRAGFTAGSMEVVAEGTLRMEEEAVGPPRVFLVAQDGETALLLVNLTHDQAARVATLAETGAAVRVTGELHLHADERPGLEPDDIEELKTS